MGDGSFSLTLFCTDDDDIPVEGKLLAVNESSSNTYIAIGLVGWQAGCNTTSTKRQPGRPFVLENAFYFEILKISTRR